jgi:hypothetical protein
VHLGAVLRGPPDILRLAKNMLTETSMLVEQWGRTRQPFPPRFQAHCHDDLEQAQSGNWFLETP